MALSDRTKHGPSSTEATVQNMLDTLGAAVLHVLAAPCGLTGVVRGSVIFDPVDPLPDGRDCALLLVGLRVDDPRAITAVQEAARAGFVAVVVKLRGGDPALLVTEASTHGLAVLATADLMPWRQLDALMASVLGAGRLPAEATSSGGDTLFALANALAAVIGGSVAIEDLEQRVLAYSSLDGQRIDPLRERGILDRQVPDYPHHRGQYLEVLQSAGVVRFPAIDDELPRAAVAVRAGDLPLGTIWAIEGESGLGADGERTLRDGAAMAALPLLRGQDVVEREQNLRGELLRAALAGAQLGEDRGERLGLAPDTQFCIVAFAPTDAEDQAVLVPRVGHAVGRYVVAYRPDAIPAVLPHAVYVLAPGSSSSARRLAQGALPALQRAAGVRLRAALSAPTHDLAELPVLRREVDSVLHAAAADGRAPLVCTVTDVHAQVLLDRLSDLLVRDPRLRHPGIQSLTDHDVQHGTDYGATVLAWLNAQSDIAGAAAILNIHPNTLRYRLRRLQERFDIDLADPDVRLSSWLQLRGVKAAPAQA